MARYVRLLVVLTFVLVATHAEAHTVFSTRGPFIGGIKHFFLSIDDVLFALAAGIVVSQSQSKSSGRAFWLFPLAWFVCGFVALGFTVPATVAALISAASLLLVGVVAAASPRLNPTVLWVGAALAGGLHGFLNGSALQPESPGAAFLQLLGIGGCALLAVIYPTALLEIFKQTWARIVARVLGSWIAATGLLLIGWTLRTKR